LTDFQLSIPGPIEYSPEVIRELIKPILPHYGPEWLEIYRDTLNMLKKVYSTEGSVYVLPCSGSGGLDAVFTSVSCKKPLILINGHFGKRLYEIASRYIKNIITIEKKPGVPFCPDEVKEKVLKSHCDMLAVVHGETSTGMLNPLEDLSVICREYNILFMVDAVSTLGGVDLDVNKLGIDFCVSASQKALGCVPGLATVSISEKGWSHIQQEKEIQGWYLNLQTWARYEKMWAEWHPYPVTLPVNIFYAFRKALKIILNEGLENRWKRHITIAEYLHKELEELGIELFIKNKKLRLSTVTAAMLPNGYLVSDLIAFLKEKYGILIAGGVGDTNPRLFRIGHMDYSANKIFISRIIAGIKEFLQKH